MSPDLIMAIEIAFATLGTTAVALLVALLRTSRRLAALEARQAIRDPADSARVEQFERTLDAIATEVDRLGERQEMLTRFVAEGRALGASRSRMPSIAERHHTPV